MSFLKSSLFYLKDINEFLRDKHYQYKSFENYLTQLKTNEKEVVPFLEKVIMNKHNYDLNKERYIQETRALQSSSKTIRVFSQVTEGLIIVAIVVYLLSKLPSIDNISEGVKYCLQAAIAIIFANFAGSWLIDSNRNRENDYEGRLQVEQESEKYFNSFTNTEAVAVFFAIRKQMSEPKNSKYYKDIKKSFDIYAVKNQATKLIDFPTVKSFTSGNFKPNWEKLVNTFQEPFRILESCANGVCKSLADDIDKKIRYSDTVTLMKEITAQGENIRKIVANDMKPAEPYSPEQIQHIVRDEIVPMFNVKAKMYELLGIGIRLDETSQIGQSFDVSSNIECMLNCEMNDKCVVAAVNIPAKKCSLYNPKVIDGNTANNDMDQDIFVKSDGHETFIINGSGLHATHTNEIFYENADKKIAEDCFAQENCVGYIKNDDGTYKKMISEQQVAFDNIKVSTEPKENTHFYKVKLNNLGASYIGVDLMQKAKAVMVVKLMDIVKKHNYNVPLLEYVDTIKEELVATHGFDFYTTIESKIGELVEEVDKKTRFMKKKVNSEPKPIYLSKESFVQNVNKMKYEDLIGLHYSIDTLNIVVDSMNQMVQTNLALNLSAEKNMFLSEERAQANRKRLIVHVSSIIVVGFVLYCMNSYPNVLSSKAGNGNAISKYVNLGFQFGIPFALIIFAIIFLDSWYKKKESVNSYNREVLEKNGSNLVASVKELNETIKDIQAGITNSGKKYALDTLVGEMSVSVDNVKILYDQILHVLDLLHKCNLLLDGADIELPFPWTDIIFSLIIAVICAVVILFAFYELSPFEKLGDIRELNMIAKKLQLDQPVNLDVLQLDFDADMGPALKFIALIGFFIMVILFGSKLQHSVVSYEMGLYNSKYYLDSKCAK